jgi:hypothetical protein
MILKLSTHTPSAWTHNEAIAALIQGGETWPDYTFHVSRKNALTVQIFVRDSRRQPIGWLGAQPPQDT